VKVVCRFRPLNEKEKAMGAVHCHEVLDDKTLSVREKEKEPLKFSFDKIFDVNTAQADVYSYAAASIIDSVVEGFNGTIFAYGQTASGKTHTMEGAIGEAIT
jgi:kinesin family protein 5